MKLLLRRDQRSGMLGKVVFSLQVRAQLSPDEMAAINKYKLGATELYSSHTIADKGSGLLGLASRLAYKAMMITVSVQDLSAGKTIECKDVVEMLAVEDQIKEAARTFAQVLAAAATFGGEQVVDLSVAA
jgi:hypothetical protein